jgi:hypothetical protein
MTVKKYCPEFKKAPALEKAYFHPEKQAEGAIFRS